MINRKIFDNLNRSEKFAAVVFLFPMVLFLGVFILVPVIGTLFTSFYQSVTFLPEKFIFLENYKNIFKDRFFWLSCRFTVMFILTSIPIEILLGLLFSLLLNLDVPFKALFRAVVLLPWVIPAAISSKIWELIFNYHHGLLNFILLKLHIFSSPHNWLGSPASAFFSLVLADVWKTTPFVAIIFLAGLQTIPKEIIAQAKVDRASPLRIFFKIIIPLLRPVFIVILLFRTIDALRIFDLIYILTKGGPGGTTGSLSQYAFNYFMGGDFGYGSAISSVLFILALVFALVYIKAGKFKEAVQT